MKKERIINREMLNSDLKDPRGWTLKNNPHPNTDVTNPLDEDDWRNWFEWDKDNIHPTVCHTCIKRAKIGSGNCQNHGEYFICLPKEVREGNVPYKKPVKTVQSKLKDMVKF